MEQTWEYVTDPVRSREIFRFLGGYKNSFPEAALAVDTETFCPENLKPALKKVRPKRSVPQAIWTGEDWLSRIRLLQIGTDPIYAPGAYKDKQFLFDVQALGEDGLAYDSREVLISNLLIGHNWKYDEEQMRAHLGYAPKRGRVIDTMLINKRLKSGIKVGHDLADLYRQEIPEPLFIELSGMDHAQFAGYKDEMQKSDWSAPELTDRQLTYGATDVRFPFFVYNSLMDKVNERLAAEINCKPGCSLEDRLRDELSLITTVVMMEMRGFPFNVERHETKIVPFLMAKLQEQEEELLGYPEFELDPPPGIFWVCIVNRDSKVDAAKLAAALRNFLKPDFEDFKYTYSEGDYDPKLKVFRVTTERFEAGEEGTGDQVWIEWREQFDIYPDEVKEKLVGFLPSGWEVRERIPINIDSTPQLKTALFKRLGKEIQNAEAKYLRRFMDDDPDVIRAVLKYKSAAKCIGTYGPGLVSRTTDRGYIHSSFNQIGTETFRFSSSDPNCFSDDTELLTDEGWKRFDCLDRTEQVAQCDLETREITFADPEAWIKVESKGSLLSFKTEHFLDTLCTEDHDFYVRNSKHRKDKKLWRRYKAAQLRAGLQLPVAGFYVGGSESYKHSELIMIAAIQADGYVAWRKKDKSVSVSFTFSKQRKIKRLLEACTDLGLEFSARPKGEQTVIYVNVPAKLAIKRFSDWLFSLDKESFNFLAEEVWFWDGCYKRRSQYCSEFKENSDWVQILQLLSGRRAKVRRYVRTGDESHKSFWIVDSVIKNCLDVGTSTEHKVVKESVPYSGYVYCVSMPKGTVIVRRNGKAVIAGNCQNIPKKSLFATREDKGWSGKFLIRGSFICPVGYDFIACDLSQIEVRLTAEDTLCLRLIQALLNGEDLHGLLAKQVLGLDYIPLKGSFERDVLGKTMNFAIGYGIGPPSLAEYMFVNTDGQIYWTRRDGQKAIDAYFTLYPEIKIAMDKMRQYVMSGPCARGTLADYKGQVPFASVKAACGSERHFTLTMKQEDLPDYMLDADFGGPRAWNDFKSRLDEASRAAYNFRIQGLAATVMKRGMLAVDRAIQPFLKDPYVEGIVATIHDELIILCREEVTWELREIVKAEMEKAGQPFLTTVPCIADVSSGKSWYKCA